MKISTKIKMAFGAVRSLSGSELLELASSKTATMQDVASDKVSALSEMIQLVGYVYERGFDGVQEQICITDPDQVDEHVETLLDTVQDLIDVFESRQEELKALASFGKEFLKGVNKKTEELIKADDLEEEAKDICTRLYGEKLMGKMYQPSTPEDDCLFKEAV